MTKQAAWPTGQAQRLPMRSKPCGDWRSSSLFENHFRSRQQIVQTSFVPPQPDPVRSRRQSDRQAWPVPKDAAPTVPNEIASLDGTNADQETKSTVAEDLLLTDDQDGELDPTEVLGAGLGKKDDT